MKRKAMIAINLTWATLCAGAFFLGRGGAPGGAGMAGDGNPRAGGSGVSALAPSFSGGEAARGDRGGVAGGRSAAAVAERLAAALEDSDPIRGKADIAMILANLSPENLGGVLAAFESGPRSDEADRHFRDFLYAWGRMSAADAVAYALDPESPRRGRWGSTSAIAGWAASDPEGARRFVDEQVEDVGNRQWLRYGVMREMLQSDLQGAIAYAEENDRSRARGMQLDKLAGAIEAQRGVVGLTEWAEGIDHAQEGKDLLSYKTYAVGLALDKMAAENPQAAADWITENAGQPYLTADGLERAARRAAGTIDEELDWLTQLPTVKGQGHAIGERFEDFIRDDFAGAGEWLAAQPLGPNYDEAIEDYARSAAGDDREAALAWAERITDPERRAKTVERIMVPRRG